MGHRLAVSDANRYLGAQQLLVAEPTMEVGGGRLPPFLSGLGEGTLDPRGGQHRRSGFDRQGDALAVSGDRAIPELGLSRGSGQSRVLIRPAAERLVTTDDQARPCR